MPSFLSLLATILINSIIQESLYYTCLAVNLFNGKIQTISVAYSMKTSRACTGILSS